MADTKRSLTDLLTNLFQDGQADNSISEQDVRDLIVSMAPPHGGASMAGNASETTINTAGVYELVAGVFVGGGVGVEFTESATNGRLTYTGTPDRHMHVVSNFDMTCASNNQVLAFQWFKNGVALPVPVERKVSTGTDIGAASLHADVHLATGDYLELKVANLTSNANVTMKNVCLFVMGMLA